MKNQKYAVTGLNKENISLVLAALGLTGFVAGCGAQNPLVEPANAQEAVNPPTATPSPVLPTLTPTFTATPLPTPWPTATPAPTATPWAQPVAWKPAALTLPVLQPVPVVSTPAVVAAGLLPVSYSPPNGVDVFGGTTLRWEYGSALADDEWFDIRIKPAGSQNSVFVDWTKSKEYNLNTWSGWQPGVYTWQIGIIKGYKEGDAKHFIEDTGHASQPFVIKWQGSGGGGGGGGAVAGGGGGGGGRSGGS